MSASTDDLIGQTKDLIKKYLPEDSQFTESLSRTLLNLLTAKEIESRITPDYYMVHEKR